MQTSCASDAPSIPTYHFAFSTVWTLRRSARLAMASHHPCTGARRRISPLDGLHGLSRRGADPFAALKRRAAQALPARQPSSLLFCATPRRRGAAVEAAGAVDAQNAPTSSLEN